jgi:hypothetical protein
VSACGRREPLDPRAQLRNPFLRPGPQQYVRDRPRVGCLLGLLGDPHGFLDRRCDLGLQQRVIAPSVASILMMPWGRDGGDLDLDGPPAIAYHHYAAGHLTTTYRVV